MKILIAISLFFICTVAFGQDAVQYSVGAQPTISESLVRKAKILNISVEEVSLLENLKHKYQGVLSSDLSPLEWLGIFAESDSQRKKYAQLLAEQQMSILTAISKFETAYLDALNKLANSGVENQIVGKHLALITPFSCNEDVACQEYLQTALEHMQQGGKLDIYIQGISSNAELRLWASTHRISFKKIESKQVTINHADTRFRNLKSGIYISN